MNSISLVGLFLIVLAAIPAAFADNLIANPGFESGAEKWGAFIPPESAAQSPGFTVITSGARTGRSAARLASTMPTRFAIVPRDSIHAIPGERYRISLWYRAESGVVIVPGTPGLLVRVTFIGGSNAPDLMPHFYIGPGSVVANGPSRTIAVPALATKWTRISAVIEVPPDVIGFNPNIFFWSLSGVVFVDDVSVELVPAGTPLTWSAAPSVFGAFVDSPPAEALRC